MNNHSEIVPATDVPPGLAGEPYVISSQEGEIIYVPRSRSLTHLLVTARESEHRFTLIGRNGSVNEPTGFHVSRRTHDVFICLKGSMKFWIDAHCRTLRPGDFVSVPRDVLQQYQILDDHTEMISLSTPGGGEDFFRSIGEEPPGPFWHTHDHRDVAEQDRRVRLARERHQLLLYPPPERELSSDWQTRHTDLPDELHAYFLRNGSGPAYLVGGTVCRPLITTAESDGYFSIASLEGSSHHRNHCLFSDDRHLRFRHVHHAILVVEGVVEFAVGTCLPALLPAGQVIYIPADLSFAIHFRSRYAKIYVFASGKGLVALFMRLGVQYEYPVPPNRAQPVEIGMLERLQQQLEFRVC